MLGLGTPKRASCLAPHSLSAPRGAAVTTVCHGKPFPSGTPFQTHEIKELHSRKDVRLSPAQSRREPGVRCAVCRSPPGRAVLTPTSGLGQERAVRDHSVQLPARHIRAFCREPIGPLSPNTPHAAPGQGGSVSSGLCLLPELGSPRSFQSAQAPGRGIK